MFFTAFEMKGGVSSFMLLQSGREFWAEKTKDF
jgi:hypothetical protein